MSHNVQMRLFITYMGTQQWMLKDERLMESTAGQHAIYTVLGGNLH